jgi:cytochrome bd-type quinol oxidase subunit 2
MSTLHATRNESVTRNQTVAVGAGPTWFFVGASFLALLWLLLEGFVFDPDDFSRDHWREQVVRGIGLLLLSAPLPVAAIVSAVLAWNASARSGRALASSAYAILCAVLLALAIIAVGIANIDDARRRAGLG